MTTVYGEGVRMPEVVPPGTSPTGNGIQPRVIAVSAVSSESADSSSTTSDSRMAQYTTAARPAAALAEAGRLIRVKDPGSPELVQCCITTSGGTYEWVTVGLASS